jgi:hypothetical protein
VETNSSPADTPEQVRLRAQERVNKFWEDAEKRSAPHRQQAFSYEQFAIDYSKKGFETLTYLNGGALVALPAALAFFKAEVPASSIIAVAGSFIAGLLAVVLAQVMAFLTMTKRSEAAQFLVHEAVFSLSAVNNPIGSPEYQTREKQANETRVKANIRLSKSNQYRLAGLAIYGGSVLAFVVGCVLGAVAVLRAKNGVP